MFHAPDQYRETEGKNATKKENGPQGVFHIPLKRKIPGVNKFLRVGNLQCIASFEKGWEHLTVGVVSNDKSRFEKRLPSLEEIHIAQSLFWDDTDTVVYFFPDKTKYYNPFPQVIHLWKCIGSVYQLPTEIMGLPEKKT